MERGGPFPCTTFRAIRRNHTIPHRASPGSCCSRLALLGPQPVWGLAPRLSDLVPWPCRPQRRALARMTPLVIGASPTTHCTALPPTGHACYTPAPSGVVNRLGSARWVVHWLCAWVRACAQGMGGTGGMALQSRCWSGWPAPRCSWTRPLGVVCPLGHGLEGSMRTPPGAEPWATRGPGPCSMARPSALLRIRSAFVDWSRPATWLAVAADL